MCAILISTRSDDVDRRLTRDTDYYGNYEQTGYDSYGDVSSFRDRDNHTTTYVNDAMGRTTQETAPISGISTSWVYNAAGLLTDETDAEGHVSHDDYDSRGLLLKSWRGYGSADAVMELMTYDSAGQETGDRDAAGWTTTTS